MSPYLAGGRLWRRSQPAKGGLRPRSGEPEERSRGNQVTRQGRGSKQRSLVLLAATAAAFGLLAGACGGGSSDNNSGGTTTPSGSVAPETSATGGSEAPTSEAGSTTVPAAQATPGGKVIMGPMEVPGGDWIAIATDPQGAPFAVHSSKPN